MGPPLLHCGRTVSARLVSTVLGLAISLAVTAGTIAAESNAPFTNSLGMRMVPIKPGIFQMGETQATPKGMFGQAEYRKFGDWDEHPVHEVQITQPFLIADEEVTATQFRAAPSWKARSW